MIKRLLAFIVPVMVIGENGKPAFDRELHDLFIISEQLEWKALFDKSALNGNDIKLTIKGLKILHRLAKSKSGKVTQYNKEPIKLDFTYNNNSGKNAEITLDMLYSEFYRASVEDDKNGIDYYLYDMPLQLKTFSHGITEYCNNILDGNTKKNGISSVNCTLSNLEEWEFPE